MSLSIDTKPTPIEAEIERADAERIATDADAATAKADAERMLCQRGDAELERLAGDLPNDPKALWLYAEHSLAQMAVSTIDAGRALLKLKEQLPHGEFGRGLKSRGIPTRTAQRMIVIARRFSDRSEKLVNLGRSKLYACTELFYDEEIDTLEDGGEVLGITLDKMERMTAAELRALVKKREQELEVKDQLLEAKNKQIDQVAEENAALRGGIIEPDAVNPVVQEIEKEKAQILIPLMRLKTRAIAMEKELNETGKADREVYFTLQAALDTLRDEMAQAMDASYNAGAPFQGAIEEASMPSGAPV